MTIVASWAIHLYCDCPNCKKNVDLIESPDFDFHDVSPMEHDTHRSQNLEVSCPECGEIILVDYLEY